MHSYLTFTVLVRGYKDCNTILDVSRDCNTILESSQGKELRPKMTFSCSIVGNESQTEKNWT